MSSSKPHKSLSGSFHDSDSKSSIEYVQTQSSKSPNIPLTTPIASSMNLSGLNIDVGNPKVQPSSNWSIPNISVTPIPPNPTNTQMHVSEGPGSTPEISSKAYPQSKFPHDFLLNPGWNPVASQEPFGQSKQPTLNIPSGSQVHVGNEKRIDGGQQRQPLENVTQSDLLEGNLGLTLHQSDELYASLPLVHKEKVTGNHHPYASKPRIAHASSSREKIVDDEDENMSPNHTETNDEPRRDDIMAHEEGTLSNSELTHPQMPLSQSMLEQSEVRQQRNQVHKAHNVEECASQKEEKRWLKAELPENVHGMRSAVHSHCLFLLKVRDKNFSSLPAPKSMKLQFKLLVIWDMSPRMFSMRYCHKFSLRVSKATAKNELHKLGLKRFTWDWECLWQHLFNKLMSMVFYHTFCLTLVSTEYHHYLWNKDHNNYWCKVWI
ncbi:hypothetical protein O181_020811 [Austropuccinia psidii MF-1]|uniref:Uncharacterized protein n=1 Tax=Austropuccinia psidii MF-1 TaxID=1389203 RepID=A0A9Q3C9S1_9BASI|nr:hypothetical protein [Austropuccinia psidii MF-1]